jgi:aerobic carbon-monoxide dehydrogenase large subunit
MRFVGQRLMRREDVSLLTCGGAYVADSPWRTGSSAFVGFVRSPVAHATLVGVDAKPILDCPGILGVFAADDLQLGLMPPVMPNFPPEVSAPALARSRLRYVGEPVAAVVVEEEAQLEDALEQVEVLFDPLPVIVDPREALLDEIVLFPEFGTNVLGTRESGLDASVDLFEGCEVVVADTVVVPRVAPCPLEGRASISWWDEEGRLHHQTSTQAPHTVKASLEAVFGLTSDAVHVVVGDVGGGFGAKFNCYPEEVVAAAVARRLGRAVCWTETRSDSMVSLHHGRGQVLDITIGGTHDGRVLGYRLDITQDAGAYADLGVYAVEPTIRMATGAYDIPRVRATGRAVLTNKTPVGAYRGTGRPEATCAIESAMNRFAGAIGRDPIEVRRVNLIETFPFKTGVGTIYDVGDYDGVLALVEESSGYNVLRSEQARRRATGAAPLLGVGVSVYVESAGAGPPREFARVTMGADGSAVVATGTSPHGQGHVTSWSMIAADVLGVRLDDVSVTYGDTDKIPFGAGTFASRSVQIGGSAVHEAATELVDRGREVSSELLEAEVGDVIFDRERGVFHVVGAPAVTRSWADVARAAGAAGLEGVCEFQGSVTFPFGAHVAVVEIDPETGDARLVRLVSVDDAGRLVNPLIAEGQRHGAMAQGAAEVLYEEFCYSSNGTPLTANLADYALVSAREMPAFELVASETPSPSNPLGAMGIGESGTVGSLAAVHGAVVDAVAHLGVRRVAIPATPERVWSAMKAAQEQGERRRNP